MQSVIYYTSLSDKVMTKLLHSCVYVTSVEQDIVKKPNFFFLAFTDRPAASFD